MSCLFSFNPQNRLEAAKKAGVAVVVAVSEDADDAEHLLRLLDEYDASDDKDNMARLEVRDNERNRLKNSPFNCSQKQFQVPRGT